MLDLELNWAMKVILMMGPGKLKSYKFLDILGFVISTHLYN